MITVLSFADARRRRGPADLAHATRMLTSVAVWANVQVAKTLSRASRSANDDIIAQIWKEISM